MMCMTVVRSSEALLALLPLWLELERAGAVHTPFQRVAWIRNWLRGPGKDCELFVLHSADHGVVAPFYRFRLGGTWLRLLGHRHSDYEELVSVAPRAQAWQMVADTLVEHRSEWDALELDSAPHSAQIQQAFLSAGGRVHAAPRDECPALELSGRFEDWLQSKGRQLRRNLRIWERDLGARGDLQVECLRTPLAAPAIEELASIEAASWKAKSGEVFFGDPGRSALMRGFLGDAESGARVYVLRVGGVAAAFAIVHSDASTWYYYWPAYREEFPSSGSLLLARIVEDAFANGVQRFDLLRGGAAYKRLWSSTSQTVDHVLWSRSARGHLLAHGAALRRTLVRSPLVQELRGFARSLWGLVVWVVGESSPVAAEIVVSIL
jgi:CelD/BcsL family acetyltransferase involved in cellulose biosynthesis